jgi:ribonucleoside-triphosphate reductase
MKIPVETYSRVSGYYRPVAQWNPGKREEFKERKFYEPEKLKGDSSSIKSDRDRTAIS